jgi:hypothetical protein
VRALQASDAGDGRLLLLTSCVLGAGGSPTVIFDPLDAAALSADLDLAQPYDQAVRVLPSGKCVQCPVRTPPLPPRTPWLALCTILEAVWSTVRHAGCGCCRWRWNY